MIKILFVCHGNICRSPMAEFVMKDIVSRAGADDKFDIKSCATSTEELGNDVHHGTQEVLKRHGVPFEKRAAKQITKEDFNNADYVIVMDKNNLRNLKRYLRLTENDCKKISLLMEHAGEKRDIDDPWYTGKFDKTYDDVCCGCKALLDRIIKNDIFD